MGTNSKTGHQSYTVAPTAVADPQVTDEALQDLIDGDAVDGAGLDPTNPDPTGDADGAQAAAAAAQGTADAEEKLAIDALEKAAALTQEVSDDPVAQYQQFADLIGEARQHLDAAEAAGIAPEDLELARSMLKGVSANYLSKLDSVQLQQIAAAHGFEHPALVGLSGSAQHPLAHWLDPAYPAGIPSKAKIQAAAQARYAKLCAGETLSGETFAGMTLADLHTLEGTSAAGPGGIAMDGHQFATVVKAVDTSTAMYAGEPSADMLAAMIDTENKLVAASYPAMDSQHPGFSEQSHHVAGAKVDAALDGHLQPQHLGKAVAAGIEAGHITADQAHVLSPQETVALLRQSTPADQRQALTDKAAARSAQLAALDGAYGKLAQTYTALPSGPLDEAIAFDPKSGGTVQLPALDGDGSGLPVAKAMAVAEVKAFAGDAADYFQAQAQVQSWSDHPPAPAVAPAQLTKDFRAWAKSQKIGDLRAAADAMSMQSTKAATRAQLQNYIAAHWDPGLDKAAIQAQVAKTTPVVKATPQAASSSTPSATATGGSAAAAAAGTGQSGSFAAKHHDLLQALQQAQATAADLPARPDQATVASWDFGPGKQAQLGGMHTKSLHTAPDGSTWMFKPDKHAHGAQAHAEAAASAALHAGGVPSVPVYTTDISGKTGSVQPLIKGAKHLPASPGSWSQAEIDAIVRYHVAAWAVGDHDGKTDNVLRTPSGGIVPIDQGQAFKFYGSDKLAIDYHPNASFGAERPVFQQAYEAHLAGKLDKGVKINPAVAHPVIAKYEKIPDTQWRAMLHSTAHQGAKHGVPWVPAMRKRAANKHKIPAAKVTQHQIAEAFLDHACARKNSLRSDFAAFFADKLKLPGGGVLKHRS